MPSLMQLRSFFLIVSSCSSSSSLSDPPSLAEALTSPVAISSSVRCRSPESPSPTSVISNSACQAQNQKQYWQQARLGYNGEYVSSPSVLSSVYWLICLPKSRVFLKYVLNGEYIFFICVNTDYPTSRLTTTRMAKVYCNNICIIFKLESVHTAILV